jgi:pimeloyl-ACP methyl ester carboxylesterase
VVPPLTERTLPVNGIDLHLAEAGPEDGLPVVLVHGFLDSWKLWRHLVGVLATAGLRVLAPDRVEPADDWALYRRWIWAGTQPGQDPDLDRQLADLRLRHRPWRYDRLEGIDHWVPVHAPDQLNQLLLEFLGS